MIVIVGLAVPYGFILNPEVIHNNSELSPTCKHCKCIYEHSETNKMKRREGSLTDIHCGSNLKLGMCMRCFDQKESCVNRSMYGCCEGAWR